MKVMAGLCTVALVMVGCAGGTTVQNGDFQVVEDAASLHILAYANGDVWGEVLLEKGVFQQPEDAGMAEGRRLTVKKGAIQVTHVSAGFPELNLPLLTGGSRGLNDLLLAPEVSDPLARWGVHFDTKSQTGPSEVESQATTGEVAYGVTCKTTQSGSNSPYTGCVGCTHARSASCGTNTCTEWTQGSEVDEFVVCAGSNNIVQRSCTTYPGTSSCGTNGPNGCAVCWSNAIFDCAQTQCSGSAAIWTNGIYWCGSGPC